MKIKFTAIDGGDCIKLICDRNIEKFKKKYPDLKIIEDE